MAPYNKTTPPPESSNPLAALLADALELAVQRPGFVAAVRAVMAPAADGGALQARSAAARSLRVGLSTLDRLVHEGMPTIGEGRMRRFDIKACKAWLAARKPGPARAEMDGDVAAIARRAGLRVGAGR